MLAKRNAQPTAYFYLSLPRNTEYPLRLKEQLYRSSEEISRPHHAHCALSPLNIHCLAPLNPRVKLIIFGVAICFQKVILNGVKSAPPCLTRNLIPRDHQRGSIYGGEINSPALWRRYNFWLVSGKAQSDLIGPHLNLISALMMSAKRDTEIKHRLFLNANVKKLHRCRSGSWFRCAPRQICRILLGGLWAYFYCLGRWKIAGSEANHTKRNKTRSSER